MKGSDFLLIKERESCPKCRAKRRNATGFCHNCGVKLFATVDHDFARFEAETLIRNWWAFDNHVGWKFRDHFMIKGARVLHREQKLDPKAFDKNYGRQTTPAEVALAFTRKENRVRHRRTK